MSAQPINLSLSPYQIPRKPIKNLRIRCNLMSMLICFHFGIGARGNLSDIRQDLDLWGGQKSQNGSRNSTIEVLPFLTGV